MKFKVIDSENLEVSIVSLISGVLTDKQETINLTIPTQTVDRDITYNIVGIGNSTFKNTKISSLTLPDGFKFIEVNAFSNCSNINVLSFPGSIERIDNAFNNTTIDKLILKWKQPVKTEVAPEQFVSIYNSAILEVPEGTYQKYASHPVWGNFKQIMIKDHPISLGDMEACSGSTANLKIFFKNDEEIAGMQFQLVLPEGISVVGDDESLIKALTERTPNMTAICRKDPDSDNCYLIAAYFLEGNSIMSGNGSILNLKLQISPEVAVGTYHVVIDDIYVVNNTINTNNLSESMSDLALKEYIIGDVNSDLKIDTQDAILVIQKYLGDDSEGFIDGAADINGDGVVDTQDAILIIEKYLNNN